FKGVVVMSVKPEYFITYYGGLPKPAIAALLRDDGAILARYPERIAPRKLPEDSPIPKAFAQRPDQGFIDGVSSIDGTRRSFVYRKLRDYPVYVSMGLDRQ